MKTFNITLSKQQLQIIQQSLINSPSTEMDDIMELPISQVISDMIDDVIEMDDSEIEHDFTA